MLKDKNAYRHLIIAFALMLMTFVYKPLFGAAQAMTIASFGALYAILTWEASQIYAAWKYDTSLKSLFAIIREHKKEIMYDIAIGLLGIFLGAFTVAWILGVVAQ